MHTIEEVVEKIKSYNPTADTDLIRRAYDYAEKAHENQRRISGEPYITHPLEIASILTNLKMDTATIAAGLLHDVIEDTRYSYEEVDKEFGREVADLVDGVTKIAQLEYSSTEQLQTESFRKMFIAMANDIRVIIIKLADRLHNMRTLSVMRPEKQVQKSKETLDIYAPIAHRLGISKIKSEFEDLALKYLNPNIYYDLAAKIAQSKKDRQQYIDDVIKILKECLERENIASEIEGRPKHYYSIYKKMERGKSFDEIYDIIAIRVLVESVNDCYAALGWVHTLWKPIPGRIKDYIAMPKLNMYQSLHTSVIGPGGKPFEIQIRTKDMHQIAEYGVAAHWKYKEGKQGSDELGQKLRWLWEIKELELESEGSDDFVDLVKKELYADAVFVFTPKGRVVELPAGSTTIDFAYRIHTDIGNKCVGGKINGKLAPLTQKLKNGDIVEVVTSASSKGPSRDWLNVAVSPHAKSKIRAFFRKADRDENIQKGLDAFEKEIRRAKLEVDQIINNKYGEFVFDRFSVSSWEDIFSAIGYGGIRPNYVLQKIKERFKNDFPEEDAIVLHNIKPRDKSKMVLVQGHDDFAIKFAKCCMPVPGDNIIGYITRGRGITVHRADCINIMHSGEKGRLIDVSWLTELSDEQFICGLAIKATDRQRLLSDISTVIGNEGINISRIQAVTGKDGLVNLDVDIIINNAQRVEKLVQKLSNVQSVLTVYRT